ncbi:MAG: SPOR domain-containing protein [Lewinellaceae bacterium]|nr:SPOR domain-containing protein [Lewinellaceae bacterium]
MIQDARLKPVSGADIDFSACGAGVQQTDANGQCNFVANSGQADCTVTVRKDGFLSGNATLDASGQKVIVVTLITRPAPVVADVPTTPTPTTETLSAIVSSQLYTLLVTDNNLQPIAAVDVDLTACGGNVYQTDPSGKCKFMLDIDGSCMLSLNKLGYESVLMPIQENATKQFIVAMTPVEKTSFQPVAKNKEELAPIAYSTTPAKANTTLLTAKTVDPVPTATLPEQPTGYAIQLAAGPGALSNDRVPRYETLSGYGNIYTKTERNLTKVRLGVYKTKEQADEILPKAKEVSKDAFVVLEYGVDKSLVVADKKEEDLKPMAYEYTAKTVEAPKAAVYFSVQIASLSDNSPLLMNKYSGLSEIGNVYVRPDNGFTRVRVGVWDNYPSAENAKQALVNLGYNDALIIVEKPGDPNIDPLLISNAKQ